MDFLAHRGSGAGASGLWQDGFGHAGRLAAARIAPRQRSGVVDPHPSDWVFGAGRACERAAARKPGHRPDCGQASDDARGAAGPQQNWAAARRCSSRSRPAPRLRPMRRCWARRTPIIRAMPNTPRRGGPRHHRADRQRAGRRRRSRRRRGAAFGRGPDRSAGGRGIRWMPSPVSGGSGSRLCLPPDRIVGRGRRGAGPVRRSGDAACQGHRGRRRCIGRGGR